MSTPGVLDFNELASAYRDQVYRQMLRLCGNKEDAEDVLIDALLAAYRHIDSLQEREAFGGWLAVIARRLCFHLRSREKLRAAFSLSEDHAIEVAEDVSRGPHEQLLAGELREKVRRTIAALPSDLGEIYVLRDLEERSGEETAEMLGISIAAMKSRLHRARKLVRGQMDTVLFRKEER